MFSLSSYGDEPNTLSYPSNTKLMWYGSENAKAYKEFKKIDKDFAATSILESNHILIRESPDDAKAIEVLNLPSKNWVLLQKTTLIDSGNQQGAAAMANLVNSLRQEAFFRSSCRLAQVQIDLTKSTQKAAFYLQNIRLNDVDENGVLHAVKDGYCRDEILSVLVAKKTCKDFTDTIKVTDNPQKYAKEVKLKHCKK